jgi:probable F420-dependent oxidoreductase
MKFVLSTAFSTVAHLTRLAPVADRCGWDAMSFSDHVVHPKKLTMPYPYTEDGERRWQAFTDWPDPLVMAGALSTITTRLHFMNNIFVLPMRNPFLVAKAAATASIVSNGRLRLCIGVGWSKDEFDLMQQDFRTRGRRCDEMITVMRKCWAGGWQSHDGEFYAFDELEMSPVPLQQIPIWVGGISDAALRRAARLGNGWISDWQSSEEIAACIDRIREYRVQYGREHEPFGVVATPSDAFTVEQYQALELRGVTHIMTQPWQIYHGDTDDVERKIDGIERYANDVIRHCA